jgi:hypothetical protein
LMIHFQICQSRNTMRQSMGRHHFDQIRKTVIGRGGSGD